MKYNIDKLRSYIGKSYGADRFSFNRELDRLNKEAARLSEQNIEKRFRHLEKKIRFSVEKRQWRKTRVPKPTYNETLPIVEKKAEIIRAISENRVVVISGETGSGKTTQIPKFCLEAGCGIDGRIGCTQPRRIAALTVARRITEELGDENNNTVGVKIRFKDETSDDNFIKIMTDGMLLAEASNDPFLNEYDTIIVDEAHERSLNIDFVMGILKTLLKKRKNLKVIITSATIDTRKFSKAFNDAPVIEVSGRMYPVEVRYWPMDDEFKDEEPSYVEMAVRAVERLTRESPWGDILIFMPTERDIRETCDLLEARYEKEAEILSLFARLSGAEQSKVFSPSKRRKIIVATNVAETSITIPGIKYVVDTGLARMLQYSPRTRTTGLPVAPISKSSADQRKGRCGRVQNGVCVRLFSEDDYMSRPLYTQPEILRSNLAEVILRMIALNLGDVSDFPFIDPPAPKNIRDGFDLLTELDAVSGIENKKSKTRYKLTDIGRTMARLPLDPRLSRMSMEAEKRNCLKEIAIISSALSIFDPKERPLEKQNEADKAHAVFNDPNSDFLSYLNIWEKYHENPSIGAKRKFCRTHFLSFRRMREWCDIHGQLEEILKEEGIAGKSNGERDYAAVHQSILTGFLSNIAVKKDKNIYKAAKGREAMIFPGSGIFDKGGSWIVAAEMVETTRLFARTAANIDVEWLESLGKELCKSIYLEPHWERNRGEVVAYEQVSLFGLVIVPRRPVSYGKIDPETANDIFIHGALIEEDVKKPFPFLKYNRELIDEVRDIENRVRRRDLLVGEHDLYDFYKEKLPDVVDVRTLMKKIKENGGDEFLRMDKDSLLRYRPDENELSLFPDAIEVENTRLSCDYFFEPGTAADGVTVKVPSTVAPTIPFESLDWIVPGLLREKITALIKGLPKQYRKQFVPISHTVDVIMKKMPKKGKSLLSSLSTFIEHQFGVDIPASEWPVAELPDHLRIRIALTDKKGREIASGRDKSVLVEGVATDVDRSAFETLRKKWEKDDIETWDFPDLPETLTLNGKKGGIVYPGLRKTGDAVSLRLFRNRKQALDSHVEGVAELYKKHFSKDVKYLKKTISLPVNSRPYANYFGGVKTFEAILFDSVMNDLFKKNIRTETDFFAHAKAIAPDMITTGQKKLAYAKEVLFAYHRARSSLHELETANRINKNVVGFLQDIRTELDRLIPEHFIDLYDFERLSHMERYIQALTLRARRGVVNLEKELLRQKELQPWIDHLNQLLQNLTPETSEQKRRAVEEFFWLLEEFKVSLFAQELKTPIPVSTKRLEEKFKDIQRMV